MKKKTFEMGTDPRTETPRELKVTGIRIDIPDYEGSVPSINLDYQIVTKDLQGNNLISTHSNSLQLGSRTTLTPGVQVSNERSVIEQELVQVIEKSGLLEKLVNKDITKFMENEQQSKTSKA